MTDSVTSCAVTFARLRAVAEYEFSQYPGARVPCANVAVYYTT